MSDCVFGWPGLLFDTFPEIKSPFRHCIPFYCFTVNCYVCHHNKHYMMTIIRLRDWLLFMSNSVLL